MTDNELLAHLLGIMPQLGIELRKTEGDFNGGLCRLKGQRIMILNTQLTTRETIRVLCQELSREDLSPVYVVPAIRHLIASCQDNQVEQTRDRTIDFEERQDRR
jgi:hypothetical protein